MIVFLLPGLIAGWFAFGFFTDAIGDIADAASSFFLSLAAAIVLMILAWGLALYLVAKSGFIQQFFGKGIVSQYLGVLQGWGDKLLGFIPGIDAP